MPEQPKTRQEQPKSLEGLFEAANRDPALKRRLLANPRAVAEEWKVTLSDQDVEQLTKLGVIVELADDVKFGRLYQGIDPRIFYPISVWKVREVVDLIGSLIPRVGYPGPETFQGAGRTVAGVNARMRNIIFYPPDDWGGGGGGSWGTIVNPGVIFYPAQLLTRLESILAARLRTTVKLQE